MSIWNHIKDTLQAIVDFIGHDTMTFLKALAATIEAGGGKVLRDAAIAAVKAAEEAGGTGQEKLAAAVASVTAVLVAEGVPLINTAIHGAIEAAVAMLKVETQAV